MHLKNLALRGFKSFASTTTMRLEPGITCVVGPNGSGKSNVVDALSWVMGEQGAKSLRGGQMADVIFAGAGGRGALGRAQVELTIDNSDGLLPIDFSEVTISRTLFRGGGSEYQINGTPARLLDVQELLSDTGMGRQMHVIVGQGQLDSILQSTPIERRSFIEEAAGVLKHQRRRERAVRKLEDMDGNLVRVLDLTGEIRRQLKPLARQAEAARKASTIQARVTDAQSRLLADELVDMRDRLRAQDESDQAVRQRVEELTKRLADARAHLLEVEQEHDRTSPAVQRATAAWSEATALHERLRSTAGIAAERVRAASTPALPPRGEDPEELERRAEDATSEDAQALKDVDKARGELEALEKARAEAEAAEEAASKELARINRVHADHREQVARLTGDVASARSRVEAATEQVERAREVLEQCEVRLEEARAESAAAGDRTDDAGIAEVEESPAQAAHTAAVARRDAARAAVDDLLTREREARAERARWESRRDTLEQSLAPDDATEELSRRDGVSGTVGEHLDVDSGWEDAVAAALAPWADAVAVDSLDGAVGILRDVHDREAGQVRMVVRAPKPAKAPKTAKVPKPAKRPDLPDGTVWAADVVRGADALPLVAERLEGVALCEDLDAAAPLLTAGAVVTAVTRGGDVLANEFVRGSGAAAASTLSLRAEWQAATEAAEKAAGEQERAAAALEKANAEHDLAVRGASDALKALREEDAERAQRAEEAARRQSALKAAESERDRAKSAVQRAEQQVESAKELAAEAERRLADVDDVDDPGEDPETAQAELQERTVASRAAREAETAARLSLRAAEELSRQAMGRARSLRQSAAREREERARWVREEAKRKRQLERAEEIERVAQRAVELAAAVLTSADERRRELEAARSAESEALSAGRRTVDEVQRDLGEATAAMHRDEVARSEIAVRLEQLEQRALDEVGISPDVLVEEYGPHTLVPDLTAAAAGAPDTEGEGVDGEPADPTGPVMRPYVREEVEAELERASKELARLGRVNPLALEEHAALSQRHDFLVSQVEDLRRSKADLLQIIDDVDRLVEEAFTQAFEDTAEAFQEVFAVLFPGGEGNLVLTEPDDMLATGIEIEARPAGKRVKRLSLLSGGERSLAALAFLIAIFKARPSPFYVMDEVEAALDDVNLSRLLQIFQTLRETSQLIVITHQKRTMEIADALYGVTMRDGVSTVVSQRLAD